MKKTIISILPITTSGTEIIYESKGNADLQYDKPTVFPAFAIFANKIQKGDDVTIILIQKENKDLEFIRNKFKSGLSFLNDKIGAKLTFIDIVSKYEENEQIHNDILRELLNNTIHGSKIYADVTYGTKCIPICVFTALKLAEKYKGGLIENIVYGLAKFNDKKQVESATLCDITSLYSLNNVIDQLGDLDDEQVYNTLNVILKKTD